MKTANNVDYEVIGIAFPETPAYKNMWICTGGPLENLSGSERAIYSFPWNSFGIEALPYETNLIELSFYSGKDAQTILGESAAALITELLGPLKPKIEELHGKNYPGLEGIILASENNSYLVSAIDNSGPFKRQPLEMLNSFKDRTYLDWNDDLNTLNELELKSAKKDNFRSPNALYGLSTLSELSELAGKLSTEEVGGTKLWLYGRNLDEGYSAGIKLLDQLYSLRKPLEKILA